MFIWDYILTFRMEVDLVWKSKWNFMKGLYLLQRYSPFIDTTWLVLYYQTGGGLTKVACRNLYYGAGATTIVGLAASDMILTLRTWAVWNRNQRLSIILPILYVLVWGSCFVILVICINSITFGDPPYPGSTGCFLMDANQNILFFLLWVQLFVWNALVLMLMLVPAVQAYRSGGNRALTRAVYRDGVIYYLYLFVLSFINVVVVRTLPPQYQQLLLSLQRVLHSMLTSRVLLHIRAQAEDNLGSSAGPTDLAQITFHHSENECNSQARINVLPTKNVSLA